MPEIHPRSGEWMFVDIGFARHARSAGLLVEPGEPSLLTFAGLNHALSAAASTPGQPLNLVLEAPLSAAFTEQGNPAGRSIEKNDAGHRYWYAGLGCQVTMAAAYLLRAMLASGIAREVRLFEAFVTFKVKGVRSDHASDVKAMRSVVWSDGRATGRIVSPGQLPGPHAHRIESSFAVFGMDLGIPPVIVVDSPDPPS